MMPKAVPVAPLELQAMRCLLKSTKLLVVLIVFRIFVGFLHDIAPVRNISVMLESQG